MAQEWNFEAGIFFKKNKISNFVLCLMAMLFSVIHGVPYTKLAKKRH
jgi:hypothetical protein